MKNLNILKHCIIKKLSRTLTILTLLIPHALFANSIAQSQSILNQLGYNAGPVDGTYGKKTRRALEKFYTALGSIYDGKLDSNEFIDLNVAMEGVGYKSQNKPKVKPTNPDFVLKKYRTKLIQPVINSRHFAHYKTSQLRNVKIPKDFDFVDERRLRFLMEQGEYRLYAKQWANNGPQNGDRYKVNGCKNILQHFLMANDNKPVQIWTRDGKKLMVLNNGNHEIMNSCHNSVTMLMHQDYKYAINEMSDIILHHATYQNVREAYLHPKDGINHMQYQKYIVMSHTAEFYAYFKDLMPLAPPEHEVIKDYFDTIFAGNVFHTQQRRAQCNINNPSLNASTKNRFGANGQSGIGINGCGSYAFQMVNASLLYSMSTNNAVLFEQAKKNATHMLGSFDDEGIQTAQASRGAMAWGYHTDVTMNLSYMAEIFNSIGYDFYEHKMPRSGIKVKDVMFKHWEAINDHTVLSKYAKYNKGVFEKWTPEWDKISTRKATLAEKPWRHIALSSPRFINTYVDTLPINGKTIDLRQVVASKSGGKNNWYNQWIPNEYLYYMNIDK
jgi:hypothetical protein